MKMRVLSVLMLGWIVAGSPAFVLAQEEESDIPILVKASFEAYREAILEDDGARAAKFVSHHTIDYYDEIVVQALTADSMALDTMSLIDKMTILIIRGKMSAELLKTAGPGDGFIFSINEGLVGKEEARRNDLGKVFYDSTFARAPMIVDGQQTPLPMHFHLEEGVWKLDLTSLFPISEPVFTKMIEESGMPENEFLQLVVTITLEGEEEANPIWHPIP